MFPMNVQRFWRFGFIVIITLGCGLSSALAQQEEMTIKDIRSTLTSDANIWNMRLDDSGPDKLSAALAAARLGERARVLVPDLIIALTQEEHRRLPVGMGDSSGVLRVHHIYMQALILALQESNDRRALPDLLRLSKSEDQSPEVRLTATQAVKRIHVSPPPPSRTPGNQRSPR